MKRCFTVFILICVSVFSILPLVGAEYKGDIIDRIKLSPDDIPGGFAFGSVPPGARKVIKENPWKMDKEAIRRLASHIYPGGDPMKIATIHVTIMTHPDTPFGDDIVCYIILYKDSSSAKGEMNKLVEFAGFNSDRVIVLTRDNMAIYLHVDDTKNFPLLKEIALKIEERIEGK